MLPSSMRLDMYRLKVGPLVRVLRENAENQRPTFLKTNYQGFATMLCQVSPIIRRKNPILTPPGPSIVMRLHSL